MSEKDELKVRAIPSVNPRICRFEVSRPLIPSGQIHFKRSHMDSDLSLVKALFEIPQVEEISIQDFAVMVSKSSDGSWKEIAKQVGGAIRENLSSTYSSQEKKLQEENKPSPGQCETSSKIQRILDEKINPGVAQHGGRIGFVKYENQRVYITMEGGCQGCSMSKVTLKSGVERSLQEEIPELLEVVDVTDHSQGANPYHS